MALALLLAVGPMLKAALANEGRGDIMIASGCVGGAAGS
jgi:hypothetical protein